MEQVNTLSQRNNIYYNSGSIMSNDLLFSSDILSNINYYKTSLANTAGVLSGPAGKKDGDSNKVVYHSIVSPSLFNVYQSVYSAGISPNIPLLDTINEFEDFAFYASFITNLTNYEKQNRFIVCQTIQY